MTRTLGIIECMELDRVNFRLTLTVSDHPRRGEPRKVVEQFDSLQALLDLYDTLIEEDERASSDVACASEDKPPTKLSGKAGP